MGKRFSAVLPGMRRLAEPQVRLLALFLMGSVGGALLARLSVLGAPAAGRALAEQVLTLQSVRPWPLALGVWKWFLLLWLCRGIPGAPSFLTFLRGFSGAYSMAFLLAAGGTKAASFLLCVSAAVFFLPLPLFFLLALWILESPAVRKGSLRPPACLLAVAVGAALLIVLWLLSWVAVRLLAF